MKRKNTPNNFQELAKEVRKSFDDDIRKSFEALELRDRVTDNEPPAPAPTFREKVKKLVGKVKRNR